MTNINARPDDSGLQDSDDHIDGPSDVTLSRQSIDDIELRVCQLTEQSNVEQIIAALNLTSILLSRSKVIRSSLERIAVQWITVHGPIDIGDIRYTVGHQKHVACLDIVRCAQSILDACGGDLAMLCAHLRSDPYKYGSVNNLLGDAAFATLFRVDHRPKLVEGKPQSQLIRVDRRYL